MSVTEKGVECLGLRDMVAWLGFGEVGGGRTPDAPTLPPAGFKERLAFSLPGGVQLSGGAVAGPPYPGGAEQRPRKQKRERALDLLLFCL